MSRTGGGIMGSGDAPLSQKIFIGGVGQTSEEDIQKEFSNYGNVSSGCCIRGVICTCAENDTLIHTTRFLC